ncbi:MAG: amidase [Candidatus Obscuribacterales bacterium]|nr:amidase [Candidatus Obscuribacterales bacterium]
MESKNKPYLGIVEELHLKGNSIGPLAGTTFVAKDLFDVAGFVTGAGNPDWKRTHEPAARTAAAIQQLLNAGSDLVGKALTDELALSLDGINTHYGTPLNPQLPDCIPGGSSSGSISATAAGYADFGLGTDTLGSIRVPSSYCGLFGIRPTMGSVDLTGAIPLGPSFDTVGWCARSAKLLARVGDVLLQELQAPLTPWTDAVLLSDCFALMPNDNLRDYVQASAIELLRQQNFRHAKLALPTDFLTRCTNVFNAIRGYEAAQLHGKWMDDVNPAFGPGIRERFEQSKLITQTQFETARVELQELRTQFQELTGGRLLVLPTVCDWPPLRDSSQERLQMNRLTNVKISVLASLTGRPQVTMPVAAPGLSPVADARFGVSFMAQKGQDKQLLSLLKVLSAQPDCKEEQDTAVLCEQAGES